MIKQIQSIRSSFLLAIILCISICSAAAVSAASADSIASATIPVSVTVGGNEGTAESDIPEETYTFVLEALGDAPLPEQQTLTVTGAGGDAFTIQYQHPGVYQYTLKQDVSALTGEKSSCHDRGRYDTTVYYVTVTVTNTDGGSFGVTVSAHKGGPEEDKTDTEFDNRYDPVPYEKLTVNKTWTDNAQTRPSSISVRLYDGETLVDTAELTEDGWSYTWENLDPYGEHSWNVKEVPVEGYTASYKTEKDGSITIHNEGAAKSSAKPPKPSGSPKTGDRSPLLQWMLLMMAAALSIAGLMRSSRKKSDR
ncbi:MAG: Cna B-type domain-containing protein [Lachnospiraceae bacterium]|nr:Cna B-type domain-containing protein [Lachnospiraceae bacterium]